jgi:hypothetical protein
MQIEKIYPSRCGGTVCLPYFTSLGCLSSTTEALNWGMNYACTTVLVIEDRNKEGRYTAIVEVEWKDTGGVIMGEH